MHNLEVGEGIYSRFVEAKSKYKPKLTDEEFLHYILNEFELSCSNMDVNLPNKSEDDKQSVLKADENQNVNITEDNNEININTDTIQDDEETIKNDYIDDGDDDNNKAKDDSGNNNNNNKDNVTNTSVTEPITKREVQYTSPKVYVCPECKLTTSNLDEIEIHFTEKHELLNGLFPCTCGVTFAQMSHFLIHYIQCPIAATDLHPGQVMTDTNNHMNHKGNMPNGNMKEDKLGENHNDDDEEENDDNIIVNSIFCNGDIDLENDLDDDYLDENNLKQWSHSMDLLKNGIERDSTTLDTVEYLRTNNIITDHINNLNPNSPTESSVGTGSPNGNSNHSYRKSLKRRTSNGCNMYGCDHCEKSFKSKGLLDQHKHLHYPPRHECEYCGRRFRWPPQFYTHKQQCIKRRQALINASMLSTGSNLASLTAEQLLLGNMNKKFGEYPNTRFNALLNSESINNHKKPFPAPISVDHYDEDQMHNSTNTTQNPKKSTSNVNNNQQSDHNNINNNNNNNNNHYQNCICGFRSNNSNQIYDHKRTCLTTAARTMLLQKLMDCKSQTPLNLLNPPNLISHSNYRSKTSSITNLHSLIDNNNSMPHLTPESNPSHPPPKPTQINPTNHRSTTTNNNNNNYDEKKFECGFCESRFMTKISLKQHIDGKHSDQARYCCEKCGKGYYWNASYNYHKKKCCVAPLLKSSKFINSSR